MKIKLLILTIAIFITANNILAQSVEKDIVWIRAEVTAINKAAKGYKKTVKDVEDISLEGTQATYFSSGKGLRKITAQIYGESFKSTLELYYSMDELIFAYEKTSKYNGTIGMKNLKVAKIEEHRYYFNNSGLIRLLVGKKELKSSDENYDELKQSVESISEKLLEAFRN